MRVVEAVLGSGKDRLSRAWIRSFDASSRSQGEGSECPRMPIKEKEHEIANQVYYRPNRGQHCAVDFPGFGNGNRTTRRRKRHAAGTRARGVARATAQTRDPQAANQPISLTVMLNLTDQGGFKAFEASLQDPVRRITAIR
jgi:hypothetical protein